jgi:hypothetical protein
MHGSTLFVGGGFFSCIQHMARFFVCIQLQFQLYLLNSTLFNFQLESYV